MSKDVDRDRSKFEEKIIVGFCTVPTAEVAQKIAKSIVKAKLAACVNIIPKIISYYYWDEQLNKDNESLLLIKTKPDLKESVTGFIKELHPYEVPEIIFSEFSGGNQDYLQWIYHETK